MSRDSTDHAPVEPGPPAASEFFEKSLDHLCIVDFDGCFVRVNPAWTRTLGWTSEELRSTPSIDLVHPDDRAMTLAGRARLHAGAALGYLRNRYRCKDGSYRWFEWRSVAELERTVVYAAARDITDQVLAEERLREATAQQEKLKLQLLIAERMASLGTLAAGSAHQINNPLVSVTTNILMMLEELGGLASIVPADRFAELSRMVNEARVGAEQIGGIVRGLKTFSRVSEARLSVVDVKPVIELVITLARSEIQHRARLVLQLDPAPTVLADDARLGQVLINLLVNAVQAIPEGESANNEIQIMTSTDQQGRAVIEISDTGAGIPPALAERIFDPFFTTKPIGVGTGLGLSICHNIITDMGGQISATSGRPRGTTFRIVLPAAAASRADAAVPPAVERAIEARGSVLVVDDDSAVGKVLLRVLKQHDVTITSGAKQALAVLETGQRFDMILSDLMMPEMTGMELHAEITRRFPEVAARMVFMSGGVFTEDGNSFLDGIPNVRVDKPFDPPALRALLQRFIHHRARTAHPSATDEPGG